MDYQSWPLEAKVAQLFMLGYSGAAPNPITQRFLAHGLGGLIFFRDNFDSLQPLTATAIHDLLADLSSAVPSPLPRPLLGIDQEGGQVERLPHTVFPTALTPMAVALSPEPEALARDMYGMMASHLRQLGLTLDFFPTLDVNLNPQNPIIGVRSFGDSAERVWSLGRIALEEFEKNGLIAVGKHFPGHGNGTVDSHLDLPTLYFTEEELKPFQQEILAGLPAMLVAHGYYPALQTTDEERDLPSSASPAIIQGLLRKRCGFDGVVITDDMCMGAITKHRSPVEAALASLRAGVDILLYKQSTDDEWTVYEAVLDAFRTSALPMAQLHQSLARILRMKVRLIEHGASGESAFNPANFTPEACQYKADALARRGMSCLAGNPALLPMNPDAPLLLIHPDRATMGNYAFDVPTSENLEVLFRQAGFRQLMSATYPPMAFFEAGAVLDSFVYAERTSESADRDPEATLSQAGGPHARTPQDIEPKTICMVAFNALRSPDQIALYQLLRERFPAAKMILASAGMPDSCLAGTENLPSPDLHLGLCSYRPASMRAFASALRDGPPLNPAGLAEGFSRQFSA